MNLRLEESCTRSIIVTIALLTTEPGKLSESITWLQWNEVGFFQDPL